ncbi:hypothetical protein FRC07_004984 [Ceratobasidium sp. 392]|nr:hypothetical protein FRC07_004984 [Ceratobasidium sp. 392]
MRLEQSAGVAIDICLWENPLDSELMKNTICYLSESTRAENLSATDIVIQGAKGQIYQWRSLEIAFCTMSCIEQMLQFLRGSHKILHLEPLTIGPMGSTAIITDEAPAGSSPLGHDLADITTAQSLFYNLDVTSKRLRVNTFPVGVSPVLLSPHLTSLEIFTGCYYNHTINLKEWAQILSGTPNLLHLRLVSFRHRLFERTILAALPAGLFASERLELTGAFILLTDLFATSLLPMLEYLLLNSNDESSNVGSRLATIASVAGSLRRISISTKGVSHPIISKLFNPILEGDKTIICHENTA